MLETIDDIRSYFKVIKALPELHVVDKSGVKMLEIIGVNFLADEPAIFGTPNVDYMQREIEWYNSRSLDVNDFPGGAPAIWKQVADIDGYINSNYGYLAYSKHNYSQYENVINELTKNPFSRRAIMIYTRPSIWNEYNIDGRSDFICTNTVQYFIRKDPLITGIDKLHVVVNMRSNDVIFGYKNDYHWQKIMQERVAKELNVECGNILWQCGSLHIYERHFHLVT